MTVRLPVIALTVASNFMVAPGMSQGSEIYVLPCPFNDMVLIVFTKELAYKLLLT